MKKLLLILSLFLSTIVSAEVTKFTAYEFSYKTHNEYSNYWTDWSSWQDCNILIVINIDIGRINIYSASTQEFDIIQYYDIYTDNDGDSTLKMECVDADGVRCTVRIIIRQDGTKQLYCDYSNIMYVYNMYNK